MNAVLIARVCHQTNKAYCEAIRDFSQKDWEDAAQWQRESAIAGVQALIDDPSLSPEEMHQIWMNKKATDGWTFGAVKDEQAKTHPCMVEFNELPKEQQVKDHLFHAVVKVLGNLPPGYVHV